MRAFKICINASKQDKRNLQCHLCSLQNVFFLSTYEEGLDYEEPTLLMERRDVLEFDKSSVKFRQICQILSKCYEKRKTFIEIRMNKTEKTAVIFVGRQKSALIHLD